MALLLIDADIFRVDRQQFSHGAWKEYRRIMKRNGFAELIVTMACDHDQRAEFLNEFSDAIEIEAVGKKLIRRRRRVARRVVSHKHETARLKRPHVLDDVAQILEIGFFRQFEISISRPTNAGDKKAIA
ncbi:MAG TPA: hypothetical protein VKX17_04140 [Planctomycetota bacterium]|nr:hypothetical protein [Planctomycetota bacterium]